MRTRMQRFGFWGWLLVPLLSWVASAGAEPRPPVSLQPSSRLQIGEMLQQETGPAYAAGTQEKPRSLGRALLYSAILPGAGEYYAGHPNRALLFGTIEAGIWISYATFRVQEDLRQDRAIEYAVAVAGAVSGGDNDYYGAVAQFLRSDGPGQWNEFVRRRARDSGEVVGVEYIGEEGWAWPSEEQFIYYRDLRKGQLAAEDNATNMLAVAIVNRIASMVDVFQAMRSDRRKAEGFSFNLRLGRTPREPLACLALQRRF